MILIEVKEHEPIEKAIKRFKKKVDQVKILKEVKYRRYYTKPSIRRKEEKIKACYKQKMRLLGVI